MRRGEAVPDTMLTRLLRCRPRSRRRAGKRSSGSCAALLGVAAAGR